MAGKSRGDSRKPRTKGGKPVAPAKRIKVGVIDYKDVAPLPKFISERGKSRARGRPTYRGRLGAGAAPHRPCGEERTGDGAAPLLRLRPLIEGRVTCRTRS